MNAEIENKLEEIGALCERHGVATLELFGSAARGTDFDMESSDLDVLVVFKVEGEGTQLASRYFAFVDDLQRLFDRKVDVGHGSSPRVPGSEAMWASIDADRELIFDGFAAIPDSSVVGRSTEDSGIHSRQNVRRVRAG